MHALAAVLRSHACCTCATATSIPDRYTRNIFSGVFTDRMVLQRSPTAAQVFGVVIGAEASTSVHVTMSVRGEPDYSVTAHMVATHKAGYMRWHAVLRPHAAGGNATITASCTSCQSPDNASAIHDVVFGDVWFCRCAWHVVYILMG